MSLNETDNKPLRTYSEEQGKAGDLVETLIAELVKLRDTTNPEGGDETAKGKDLAAFLALMQAGALTKAVAQWAIDHQVGLALENLDFVPLVPSKTKTLPEYIDARREVDSHRHERAGMETDAGAHGMLTRVLTTEQRRAVAISMLRANAGGFPLGIAEELAEALESVSSGKVAAILKPPTTYRKTGLLRMREELNAVCFATFRSGTGFFTSGESWDNVAMEYGFASSTLRGWETAARREFGNVYVAAKQEAAANAASHVAAVRKGNLSRALQMMQAHPFYGDEALRRSVDRHRLLLKTEPEKKARGPRRSRRASRNL